MKTPHIYFLLLPITFAAFNGCTPETSEAQDISLEEYMELDNKAQNELIFDIQDKIFQELAEPLRGDNLDPTEIDDSVFERLERAECVADLFSNDAAGIQRFKKTKGTLVDAANKKLERSAEEIAGLVINHLCPPTTVDGNGEQ